MLTARAVGGGWILDGSAPWVTGWGRIDVVHAGARDPNGGIVWALVDAQAGPTLLAEPLRLAAMAASATVTLSFRKHFVAEDRVTSIQPVAEWAERDAATLRVNGSLALGVAGRCCSLLGGSPLAEELRACRAALDRAAPQAMPKLRAWASDLAMRAAAMLVIAGGGRSILLDQHAQRLAREALFLLVFGQTASIRAAQLERARDRGRRMPR
jgi:alkylation response protein AidB-like acyl-CoA dehydrogenase